MATPDNERAEDQERRAREIADTWRRYLIAINSGAMVIIASLAGALASKSVPVKWAAAPLFFYSVSLLITGCSFALAKRKALARRDAYREGREQPDYTPRLKRNETWDLVALVIFAMGAVATVVSLWYFASPPDPSAVYLPSPSAHG